MEVLLLPESFDARRFALTDLHAAAERAHVTYTGWPFLYIHHNTPERTYTMQDGWETFVHTKDFGNDDLMDFCQFRQSGFFYLRTTLRPSLAEINETPVPFPYLKALPSYPPHPLPCPTPLH